MNGRVLAVKLNTSAQYGRHMAGEIFPVTVKVTPAETEFGNMATISFWSGEERFFRCAVRFAKGCPPNEENWLDYIDLLARVSGPDIGVYTTHTETLRVEKRPISANVVYLQSTSPLQERFSSGTNWAVISEPSVKNDFVNREILKFHMFRRKEIQEHKNLYDKSTSLMVSKEKLTLLGLKNTRYEIYFKEPLSLEHQLKVCVENDKSLSTYLDLIDIDNPKNTLLARKIGRFVYFESHDKEYAFCPTPQAHFHLLAEFFRRANFSGEHHTVTSLSRLDKIFQYLKEPNHADERWNDHLVNEIVTYLESTQ